MGRHNPLLFDFATYAISFHGYETKHLPTDANMLKLRCGKPIPQNAMYFWGPVRAMDCCGGCVRGLRAAKLLKAAHG